MSPRARKLLVVFGIGILTILSAYLVAAVKISTVPITSENEGDSLRKLNTQSNILSHEPKENLGDSPKSGEERSFNLGDGVNIVMCFIPKGECQLGSSRAERDAVMRQLIEDIEPTWLKTEAEEVRGMFKTKGFWLAKHECTQEQFERLMGKNPSYFDGSTEEKGKGRYRCTFPVEQVSWNDAQDFLTKLNSVAGRQNTFNTETKFALPSEDQWEYAYRGGLGNQRAFYWGNALNSDNANHDGNFPFGTRIKGDFLQRPTVADTFATKAPHPWHLADMAGNVLEWCDNFYDHTQQFRILRGGSWRSEAWCCRGASRSSWLEPDFRIETVGFRVCLSLE
jgi:formylglycine-generating enzyme required for sulfatase activity